MQPEQLSKTMPHNKEKRKDWEYSSVKGRRRKERRLGEGNRGVMGRGVLKSRRRSDKGGRSAIETRIPGRFGNALPEEREPVTGRLEAGVGREWC